MRSLLKYGLVVLVVSIATAPAVGEETKVNVTGVHLCCQKCVTAAADALAEVKGVKHEVNQDEGAISITACCASAAQNAVDAVAAAGFHGRPDNRAVHFKPVHPPQGKITRLELVGVHNCCGGCTKAIKAALSSVEGVQADTVKAKQTSFVVEGEFKAAEVIEAVFNAGFHCDVKE